MLNVAASRSIRLINPAITATAAYRQRHPQGPLAGMGARLAAHRQAVLDGADPGAPSVEPGACGDSRPRL